MKISFSTLGCPNFSWTEIYTMAKDLGFDGIEIRGLGKDIFSLHAPFGTKNLSSTVETLKKLRLEISCFSSDLVACNKDFDKNAVIEYIDLAKAVGVKYIRILGDKSAGPTDEIDDNVVIENIKCKIFTSINTTD